MMDIVFIFALSSAILSAANSLLTRYILKDFDDHWAFSVGMQIIIIILSIPVIVLFRDSLFSSFTLYSSLVLIILVTLFSLFIVIGYKSHKSIKATERTIINQTKTVWIVFLAMLFLGEVLSINKIIGIALIVSGTIVISIKKGKVNFAEDGTKLTIISTILGAFIWILTKVVLGFIDPVSLLMIISISSFVIILQKREKNKINRIKYALRNNIFHMIPLGIIVIFTILGSRFALFLGDVSVVAPIFSLNIIFIAFGGILFLNEKPHKIKLLVSIIAAFIGSVLIMS